MKCPHSDNCGLYPLFSLRASLRTWQIRYCDGEYDTCIRYRMTERNEPVPQQLLPNGKSLPSLRTK